MNIATTLVKQQRTPSPPPSSHGWTVHHPSCEARTNLAVETASERYSPLSGHGPRPGWQRQRNPDESGRHRRPRLLDRLKSCPTGLIQNLARFIRPDAWLVRMFRLVSSAVCFAHGQMTLSAFHGFTFTDARSVRVQLFLQTIHNVHTLADGLAEFVGRLFFHSLTRLREHPLSHLIKARKELYQNNYLALAHDILKQLTSPGFVCFFIHLFTMSSIPAHVPKSLSMPPSVPPCSSYRIHGFLPLQPSSFRLLHDEVSVLYSQMTPVLIEQETFARIQLIMFLI